MSSAAESIPFELRAIDAEGVSALVGLSPRTVLEKIACRQQRRIPSGARTAG